MHALGAKYARNRHKVLQNFGNPFSRQVPLHQNETNNAKLSTTNAGRDERLVNISLQNVAVNTELKTLFQASTRH